MPPTARDGGITAELLGGAGIETLLCKTLQHTVDELNVGAAAILVAEEHLAGTLKAPIQAWLSRQPPWSDLPILILTRPGADSPDSTEAWRTLGNVTLLERPTRVTTLLSAAQTAIRARSRQYQIRGHLAERIKSEQALRTADRRKDEFLATLGHQRTHAGEALKERLVVVRRHRPNSTGNDSSIHVACRLQYQEAGTGNESPIHPRRRHRHRITGRLR